MRAPALLRPAVRAAGRIPQHIARSRAALAAALLFSFLFSGNVLAARWGPEYFTEVPLVNQDGKTLRFYDDVLKDKTVAINVIYTRCTDTCPLETARLAQLQRLLGARMGKDIYFYSISIDPAYDTPERLKAYMKKYGVGPGWQFLTGKPEDVNVATKKLGLQSVTDRFSKDGHTSILMVGNVSAGQWMRNSAQDNPRFLADKMASFLGWRQEDRGKSYAEAKPITLHGGGGQYLFQIRCAACHTVGKGDSTGPDLQGVTRRREHGWLVRYILAPERVLASGDPIAKNLNERYNEVRMPNLALGSLDAEAIISYLAMRESAPARTAQER